MRSCAVGLFLSLLAAPLAGCGRIDYDAVRDGGPPIDACTRCADLGPVDAGPVDAGPVDAGPVDAGMPDAGPVDAGPMDAGPVDAGIPDAGCVLGPWGAPTSLGLSTGPNPQYAAMPSTDALTLYFGIVSGGVQDLFQTTRPDRSSPFGAITALPGVNTAADEGTPFTRDGLQLYFYATRAGGVGRRDIYLATRASLGAPFSVGTLVPLVNSTSDDLLARLTADGLEMVFSSSRPGSLGDDLYLARRASTADAFGAPTRVTELATASLEAAGTFSADGLTLHFDSDRGGGFGSDLYLATRPDRSSPFGPARAISELNTGSNEEDVAITDDGLEIFFSSDRSGRLVIFHATRRCL